MCHSLLSESLSITSLLILSFFFLFFFNDTATTEIYTLSLHDALPISEGRGGGRISGYSLELVFGNEFCIGLGGDEVFDFVRSEEHTSELPSPCNLVCRLLLEKKKINRTVQRVVSMYKSCMY